MMIYMYRICVCFLFKPFYAQSLHIYVVKKKGFYIVLQNVPEMHVLIVRCI